MANIERLEAVMTYIKDHPEQHNQALWLDIPDEGESCGTTACFAGWTAMLYGEELGYKRRGILFFEKGNVNDRYADAKVAADVAFEALDLTHAEYSDLFYGAANRHECEVVVKAIANGEDTGKALADDREGLSDG